MSSSLNFLKNKSLHLPILLIISIISHFPFVLKSIGEPDSARIAVVVIDRITHGSDGPLAGYYFTDSIPLYVQYLAWIMRFFDYNYIYFPLIMNYTNAILGTLTIIPAYLLIKRLFNNTTIAFYSVLALTFAPSFYQPSIYGTPHLIAFFFFLISLHSYLTWIDSKHKIMRYLLLILSSIALTLTMLFKSPLALAGGIYLGILYLKKVREKERIALSFSSLILAFILFLLIRQWITGTVSTGTTSISDFLDWLNYFFGKPTWGFMKRQLKPPIWGAGILTAFTGAAVFIYYLLKKRVDILTFIVSWAAPTYFFWLFIYGNNARHFMIGVLPLIVVVIVFFYEEAPRFTFIFTGLLITGNFLITSPSHSTYFPSGNLFKSHDLLENRNLLYHSKAKAIANLDEDKIAVMGYYHNPYVLYEIVSSTPIYEAKLLTSVRSAVINIKTNFKEYMLCYIARDNPQANIEKALIQYDLDNYVFVSATYNLEWLKNKGIKTRDVGILPYRYP